MPRAKRRREVSSDALGGSAEAVELHLRELRGSARDRSLGQLVRFIVPSREVGALGELAMERERQLGSRLPSVGRQMAHAEREIAVGRLVGRRRFRFPPCSEVELREAAVLGGVGDERLTEIELVHDVEQLLVELVVQSRPEQAPPDAQVEPRSFLVGQERIGRLLDAVVSELDASG